MRIMGQSRSTPFGMFRLSGFGKGNGTGLEDHGAQLSKIFAVAVEKWDRFLTACLAQQIKGKPAAG
jgi:hypothetical protein